MRSGRLQRLLIVAALAVAILAAVAILTPGSDPTIEPGISTTSTAPGDAAPVELPDPCDLVPLADAEAALGSPLTASRDGESSCLYAGDREPIVTLRVDIGSSPDGIAQLEEERSDAIRAFGVGAVEDVEGLGDASFLTLAPTAGIALLRVVCGEVTMVIGIAGQVPDAAAIARDLAAAAMDRL